MRGMRGTIRLHRMKGVRVPRGFALLIRSLTIDLTAMLKRGMMDQWLTFSCHVGRLSGVWLS